jgi:DNA (cytosine-5)-methyltransferase 1
MDNNKIYKMVDLFAGCGGLSLGLEQAGFTPWFVNEIMPAFCTTYKRNHNLPDSHYYVGDINELNKQLDDYKELLTDITLVCGGPPCQCFSMANRQRIIDDPRNNLYKAYLFFLSKIRPKFFIMENVKGMSNKIKEIEENFKEYLGDEYKFDYALLKAQDYGVPQNRERVFIIGIRKDLDLEWNYPEGDCEEPLSIFHAISDLPPVGEGETVTEYTVGPMNDYQRLMRGDSQKITQHFCGFYGDKIRTVIQNVAEGEGKNDFNDKVDAGLIDRKYYLTSGYGNTYGRLERNKPSTTITNNLATPSALRCIHYEQNRALTPREGARIQSFPDWYHFEGNRTEVARQVGNAVPPLMAIAFANKIIETLNNI